MENKGKIKKKRESNAYESNAYESNAYESNAYESNAYESNAYYTFAQLNRRQRRILPGKLCQFLLQYKFIIYEYT